MDERERLNEIMKSQELNSKQLSLELGVSAGTISNILGGRNKPSLELLQNVANHYPFINPTWLFLGFGEMYIDGYVPTHSHIVQDLFSDSATTTVAKKGHSDLITPEGQSTKKTSLSVVETSNTRTIQKIVVFYSDGTFEER
jgi:transcriptional regulator with XRE-family HTH domain